MKSHCSGRYEDCSPPESKQEATSPEPPCSWVSRPEIFGSAMEILGSVNQPTYFQIVPGFTLNRLLAHNFISPLSIPCSLHVY
jgi:hypothetical protein